MFRFQTVARRAITQQARKMTTTTENFTQQEAKLNKMQDEIDVAQKFNNSQFSMIGTGVHEQWRNDLAIGLPPPHLNYMLPCIIGAVVAVPMHFLGNPVESTLDSLFDSYVAPYVGTDYVPTKTWGTVSK